MHAVAGRVRKILKVSSTQNHRNILNDMRSSNKWNIEASNATNTGISTVVDTALSQYNRDGVDTKIGMNISRSVPSVITDNSRSDTLLFNSLRDHGFDDIDIQDLRECHPRVVSVIWKLLSERYCDLRSVDDERGNMARIRHDNKVLNTKIARISQQNERLQDQIKSMESAYLKKESELRERMESVEQNRSEWERCAIAYKSRESKFVAEIRKQESQYVQLQTRVSRNRSVGPVASFRHSHRLEFN